MFDFTKLLSDRLYKVKFGGGLALIICSIGYAFYSWHGNNLEWYAIEQRRNEMEVDYDRWSSTMAEWRKVIQTKEDVANDIQRRKNFGPTDPLTGETLDKLRLSLKGVETAARISAEPEKLSSNLELMSEFFREFTTTEQLEARGKEADRTIARFEGQAKDITDLGEKVDKLKKEIATSTAKLNYQKRVTWAYIVGGVIATIVGIVLARQGYVEWSTAELEEKAAKAAPVTPTPAG